MAEYKKPSVLLLSKDIYQWTISWAKPILILKTYYPKTDPNIITWREKNSSLPSQWKILPPLSAYRRSFRRDLTISILFTSVYALQHATKEAVDVSTSYTSQLDTESYF